MGIKVNEISKIFNNYFRSVFDDSEGYLILTPDEVKMLFPMCPHLYRGAQWLGGAVVKLNSRHSYYLFEFLFPQNDFVWSDTYAKYIGFFNVDDLEYFEVVKQRLVENLHCPEEVAVVSNQYKQICEQYHGPLTVSNNEFNPFWWILGQSIICEDDFKSSFRVVVETSPRIYKELLFNLLFQNYMKVSMFIYIDNDLSSFEFKVDWPILYHYDQFLFYYSLFNPTEAIKAAQIFNHLIPYFINSTGR